MLSRLRVRASVPRLPGEIRGTIATWLANGISDAFSVGTSNKTGIDLTREKDLMIAIILSEFLFALPIVLLHFL